MSYYFLAQIKIHNPEEYQKYVDQVDQVFNRYKGKYLVADDAALVLEGSWDYTRTVLIEFANKLDFEEWYNSDYYRQILKFRLAAADCNTVLLKGSQNNRK